MSRERELKEIAGDLRRYYEFQKEMGVKRVFRERKEEAAGDRRETEYPRREETVTPKRTVAREDRGAAQNEEIISVPEQMGMFDSSSKIMPLEEIRKELMERMSSRLFEGSKQIVFGEGNPKARLVFVGEAPGRDEDIQGRPFVGRAGQLLNKIIEAMGLKREDVYISNIVKSRPPDNRTPTPDEMAEWEPFLFQELRSINPDVVVCLGNTASQSILKTKASLGSMRGKFHRYGKFKVMVTYHPAALLRNPNFKKPLWEDMQQVMKELGISRPGD
ncbi:MAG: uracil-DNA glycosylase [Candidatus Dadabacteria bacterium]|nr:uracil-DNA glycosylase [Candidatus Dadabacteria bacterium]